MNMSSVILLFLILFFQETISPVLLYILHMRVMESRLIP